MIEPSKKLKKRIIEFIEENDLDYKVIDNKITRFQLESYDGITFYIQDTDDKCYLVKDFVDDNNNQKFEYYEMESVTKLLETLSNYDKSLHKTYWQMIPSTGEYGVKIEKYIDDWYSDIINEKSKIGEMENGFSCVVFEDDSYKPVIRSPFNTLHEVSELNNIEHTTVEKLYFEIHPVDCMNEKYILKLLINNEEVFKEYNNFYVFSKKGLKLLIETIFTEMEQFKLS